MDIHITNIHARCGQFFGLIGGFLCVFKNGEWVDYGGEEGMVTACQTGE